MNYHNILHDNMLNGDGLRVVLFVSGCEHNCKNCHNPETHGIDSGILFDQPAKDELFEELSKDYIQGITISGGDPLHPNNRDEVLNLCSEVKECFPSKDIWVYTGYEPTELPNTINLKLDDYVNVVVYGRYIDELSFPKTKWCGSSNQTVWRNNEQ